MRTRVCKLCLWTNTCQMLAWRTAKMQPQLKQVQEKLSQLTPDRLAEVDDFIDFLQQRDREWRLRRTYAQASEPSFAKLWDNDEDAVYDDL